jgi:2-hydroxycyclohexanecarboxyl-CoA dehydrogenase
VAAESLDGRVAVVTGAGGGIGAAIAADLAELGATVVVADRDLDAALGTAQAIGGRGHALECDVTDRAVYTAALAEIERAHGAVDVLVNNAGGTPHADFLDVPAEEWDGIVELNFVAVLTACKAVLPGMAARGWGRVVSVASDAARIGMPKESIYSGAKAAALAFSKALAAEVAHAGVTVNTVCPGSTATPLLASMYTPEQLERKGSRNPSGRLGTPRDVAEAVRFFVTSGSYVTGQVLSVNGGALRAD